MAYYGLDKDILDVDFELFNGLDTYTSKLDDYSDLYDEEKLKLENLFNSEFDLTIYPIIQPFEYDDNISEDSCVWKSITTNITFPPFDNIKRYSNGRKVVPKVKYDQEFSNNRSFMIYCRLYGLYILTCNEIQHMLLAFKTSSSIFSPYISMELIEDKISLMINTEYDRICHAYALHGTYIKKLYSIHTIFRWWSTTNMRATSVIEYISTKKYGTDTKRVFRLHSLITEFLINRAKEKKNILIELNKLLRYILDLDSDKEIIKKIINEGCGNIRCRNFLQEFDVISNIKRYIREYV